MSQELINQLLDLARTNTRDSREVSKEKKIKRSNNISRNDCEESHPLEVSGETYLLASSGTSDDDSVSLSLGSPQVSVSNNNAAARTSNRTLSGITVQHAKTKSGIKVSLNVQEVSDVATGSYTKLTAELKRHGRLRELKRYEGDTPEFEQHYMATISSVKDLSPRTGGHICIGRIHARGSRSAWLANMMLVGELANDQLTKVFLYYNNEEYEIELDQELSPRQQELYHSSGIYGRLESGRVAPTLQTVKKEIWK